MQLKRVGLVCLLVDEIVDYKDLVEKVIVEASQNSSKNANYGDRDDIHHMVCHHNIAHIEHYQPSFSKKSTLPRIAYFNESPEDYHNYCCAEESSPEECTPPPCCYLFKSKEDTTHWRTESCTNTRGSTAGDDISAVSVIVEITKPAPLESVIIRPPLA